MIGGNSPRHIPTLWSGYVGLIEMKEFLLSLQFLTVIPLKIKNVEDMNLSNALIYFPAAGLFIGGILFLINNLLVSFLGFHDFISAIILVVILAALTGSIHLDGLSDTFDALFSRKKREEILEIMRDPHIGTIGVVSIISVILLKISFLSCVIPPLKTGALLIMCVLSRWILVFSIFVFPYARSGGKAKVFFSGINSRIFFFSTLITLLIALAVLKWIGLLIMFLVVVFTLGINLTIKGILGGLTGDTLGALCELSEVFILLIIGVCAKCS